MLKAQEDGASSEFAINDMVNIRDTAKLEEEKLAKLEETVRDKDLNKQWTD